MRNLIPAFSRACLVVGCILLTESHAVASPSPAFLIRDISSGTISIDPHAPFAGVADGERGYFFATTPATGMEPWVSDGTPEGTRLIRDIVPGPIGSAPTTEPETPLGRIAGGRFVFRTAEGVLWIANREATDASIVDLGGAAFVSEIGAVGARALAMSHHRNDAVLWLIDPENGAATVLRRFDDRASREVRMQRPVQFTEVGNLTYFVASDALTGTELWQTDGTVGGTRLLADLASGAANSDPKQLTASGDKLFFVASDGTRTGLWVLSGSTPEFMRFDLFRAARIFGSPDGGLFYIGPDNFGQMSILFSEGASDRFETLYPGRPVQSFDFGKAIRIGDTLFVEAGRPTSIWSVDRLMATIRTIETVSGRGTPGGANLIRWGDRVVFTALDRDDVRWIWTVGPEDNQPFKVTAQGVAPPAPSDRFAPRMLPLTDVLLYRGQNDTGDHDILATDPAGLAVGTVARISQAPASSSPQRMTAVGDRVFFVAAEKLWVSDGSQPGTAESGGPSRIRPTLPASATGGAEFGVDLQGRFLFLAADGSEPQQLWISDGTSRGTFSLLATNFDADPLALDGSRCYFVVGGASQSVSLWATDGSTEGTVYVAPLRGETSALIPAGDRILSVEGAVDRDFSWSLHASLPAQGVTQELGRFTRLDEPRIDAAARFVRLGDRIYFSAGDLEHGKELWTTDGTRGGTYLVVDINPTLVTDTPFGSDYGAGSNPQDLTSLGDHIYFFADDGEHGLELWRTDGTPAGTRLVLDIVPGPESPVDTFTNLITRNAINRTTHMVAASDRLFFVANDRIHGRELWVSDGTAEGTELLRDIMPGPAGSNPTELSAIDGVVVFNACDDAGCEVWASNGTTSGTFAVADIYPGRLSSAPWGFVAAGDTVYFAARDEQGEELWGIPRSSLPPPAPPFTPSTPTRTPTRTPTDLPAPCVEDCNGGGCAVVRPAQPAPLAAPVALCWLAWLAVRRRVERNTQK